MDKKTFVKGAAILAIAGILAKIIGAIYRIPLGNLIGSEGMGHYQMVYPIYSLLLVISSSGLPVAISRLVSERSALGDKHGAHRVLTASIWSLALIGLITAAGMYAFAGPLASALGLEQNSVAIRAISPALLFVAIMSAFRGYLQGLSRMTPTAVSQIAEQIVKLCAGLAFAGLMAPHGASYAAAGALLGVTVSEGVSLIIIFFSYLSYKRKQGLRFELAREPGLQKSIYATALPVTLGACVIPIVGAIDSVVVVRTLVNSGYTQTGASSLFGVLSGFVLPIINMPATLSMAMAMSIVPAISEAMALKDENQLHKNTSLAFRLAMLLALPCAAGIAILADPLIDMLYTSLTAAEAARAAELLRMLSAASAFLILVQTLTSILQGAGKTLMPVINLMFGAAIKVFVGLWLVGVPSINVAGAALGTLACYSLAAILDLAVSLRHKLLRIAPRDLLVPLLGTAVMSGAVIGTYVLLKNMGGIGTLISVIAGVIVYVVTVIAAGGLKPEEMARIPILKKFAKHEKRRKNR